MLNMLLKRLMMQPLKLSKILSVAVVYFCQRFTVKIHSMIDVKHKQLWPMVDQRKFG